MCYDDTEAVIDDRVICGTSLNRKGRVRNNTLKKTIFLLLRVNLLNFNLIESEAIEDACVCV